MGNYNGRQIQPDLKELTFNSEGELIISESDINVSEFSGFPIQNNELKNNSLSVAGQNVALGGSTSVSYTNLSDTGNSFPIQNSDLNNSSLTIAGNSLSLGGSATPAVTDFNGFPIGASEIDESNISVTDFSGFPLSIGTDTDTPDWNQINNVPTLPEGVTAQQAKKPFLEVIGAFENGLDGWTEVTSTATSSLKTSSNKSAEGNQSMRIQNGSANTQEVIQDFDLTDKDKLQFKISVDNVASNIRFYVDGDEKIEYNSTTQGFETIEIDISSYTGTTTLEFQTYDTNDSYIDDIGFITDKNRVKSSNVN